MVMVVARAGVARDGLWLKGRDVERQQPDPDRKQLLVGRGEGQYERQLRRLKGQKIVSEYFSGTRFIFECLEVDKEDRLHFFRTRQLAAEAAKDNS